MELRWVVRLARGGLSRAGNGMHVARVLSLVRDLAANGLIVARLCHLFLGYKFNRPCLRCGLRTSVGWWGIRLRLPGLRGGMLRG
jgi:hypothetical protein